MLSIPQFLWSGAIYFSWWAVQSAFNVNHKDENQNQNKLVWKITKVWNQCQMASNVVKKYELLKMKNHTKRPTNNKIQSKFRTLLDPGWAICSIQWNDAKYKSLKKVQFQTKFKIQKLMPEKVNEKGRTLHKCDEKIWKSFQTSKKSC